MTNPRLGLAGLLSTSTKLAAIAVAALLFQGCGPDMGPPPDQAVKTNPVVMEPPAQVRAKGTGAPLKVIGRPGAKPQASP
jgi:hypothetical protein